MYVATSDSIPCDILFLFPRFYSHGADVVVTASAATCTVFKRVHTTNDRTLTQGQGQALIVTSFRPSCIRYSGTGHAVEATHDARREQDHVEKRLAGMEDDQKSVAQTRPDTGRPQRTDITVSSAEAKCTERAIGSAVMWRAGQVRVMAYKSIWKSSFGEEGLIAPLGDLRDEGAMRLGRLLAGLPIAKGTTPDRFFDHYRGIPRGLLLAFQRLSVILGVFV